jgi:hypothetical protein
VDISQVWWIDWVFGALAVAAAAWGLRSRAAFAAGGWVLPAFLLIPIAILLVLNEFRPLYMNARHLSLLVGAFTLLFAGGLALLWTWRRWAGGLLALALVAAVGYSTVNYYTREEYAKDDYKTFGSYLATRIMPGDAVLFYPPSSWRIFEYYVPPTRAAGGIEASNQAAKPIGIYGIPQFGRSMDETEEWLRTLGDTYDRVWVLKSGTHPYFDETWHLEDWLPENMLRVRDALFFSHSSLRAQLFLPDIPVFDALPPDVQHPTTAEFGSLVRLAGYSTGPAADAAPSDPGASRKAGAEALPTQLRLYWQVLEKPQRRYKYIIQLVEQRPDGSTEVLSSLEREPYEGDIPTLYWDPGKTILEFVEFPPPVRPLAADAEHYYTFQMYDAETLEKLPVTKVADGAQQVDTTTVRLP